MLHKSGVALATPHIMKQFHGSMIIYPFETRQALNHSVNNGCCVPHARKPSNHTLHTSRYTSMAPSLASLELCGQWVRYKVCRRRPWKMAGCAEEALRKCGASDEGRVWWRG